MKEEEKERKKPHNDTSIASLRPEIQDQGERSRKR